MDVLQLFIAILFLQGCVSATCRFPGAPAHSRVTFSDDHLSEGTIALYTCERGFELLGPSRRVCGPSGRWTPDGIPFCVVNVAAGKAPMQVSTEDGGVPQRAVDGSSAPAFNPDTCSLTRTEPVPWWYVNLLEPYMVQLVRLDFGKPCCGANKPAVIVVRVGNNRPDLGTNPICNRFTGFIEEGQPLFLPCNPPMPGAFVSVHLEANTPSQLSICEAFVYTDQALPIERCPQFRDQPLGSTATYNGKCYVFYDRQPSTFKEALGSCRARGGTLVDESNSALQGFISWELWRRHRSDSSSQYWMGAVRDAQDPANWKWINGNDVTVSFWNAPGGTENCAHFDGSNDWLWADTDCQSRMHYICQHQPKTCGRPEQPPNSTMIAKDFSVGSSVEYACDDGYLLVGPTVRTCLDTGFYDEFPPVCKRIECGFPAVIAHGGYSLLNGSVSYLSHVLYSCKPGYEIEGRARLVCDIDERWNGPPPRCEEVQCNDPPGIENGRVSVVHNTSLGALAQYECTRGFTLEGHHSVECLASGMWAQPLPVCRQEPPLTSTTTAPKPSTSKLPLPNPTTPRLVVPRRTSPRPSPAPFTPEPVPRDHFVEPTTRRARPNERTTERTKDRTTERTKDRTTTEAYEPPEKKATVQDSQNSPTSRLSHIIVASRPSENQIFGSGNNIRSEQTPRVNIPSAVDGASSTSDAVATPSGAQLHIGIIIVLGAFIALIFIIAVITTVVIVFKSRNPSGSPYAGRMVRACDTAGSGGSSSSESRSGLTRSYRQAWEQLHEAAAGKDLSRVSLQGKGHSKGHSQGYSLGLSQGYSQGHSRLQNRDQPTERFELVTNDTAQDRSFPRRHHHHHHHRAVPTPWKGDRSSHNQHVL